LSDSTFVLYHGGRCSDGFTSAWLASLSLGRGGDIIYVPLQYGQPYPLEIDGGVDRILIVDFSFPRETMIKLGKLANSLVCLDHHRTAARDLTGLEELKGRDGITPFMKIVFDMERSGAMLTWEYFHPDEPAIELVEVVQDRDMWWCKWPEGREISAWLASLTKDFKTWDWAHAALSCDAGRNAAVTEGAAILRFQAAQVEMLARSARFITLGGHSVPVVNSPLLQSEIGERLCQLHPEAPFAAVFFLRVLDNAWLAEEMVFSLRSRNGFDVSEVARQFGGGGHQAAAGFSMKGKGRLA
jgi:hypothetical protein